MADQLAVNAGRGAVLAPKWDGSITDPVTPAVSAVSPQQEVIERLEQALASSKLTDLQSAAQAALDHLKSR